MAEEQFEVIIALINTGFAEVVMDAAREVGVRGGTIIHARGTGTKEMEKKYNIIITPDKEMVMILVNVKIRDAVLSAIYSQFAESPVNEAVIVYVPTFVAAPA